MNSELSSQLSALKQVATALHADLKRSYVMLLNDQRNDLEFSLDQAKAHAFAIIERITDLQALHDEDQDPRQNDTITELPTQPDDAPPKKRRKKARKQ